MDSHSSQDQIRYQKIVEDFTGFIVRWRPGGQRTFVSDSYYKYFGTSPEEAETRDFQELIFPDDREIVADRIKKIAPENPVMLGKHRVLKADGTVRWMEWSDRGLFDEDGNLIEYQSIGYDIDDRVKKDEALKLALLEVEKASRAKTEFLANMSHEIRTPLNVMVGYCDLLHYSGLTDEQKEYTKRISAGGMDLTRLLGNVLEVARMQSQSVVVNKHECSLLAWLGDKLAQWQEKASEKGLDLQWSAPADLKVAVDTSLLLKIVDNLVENGIKFTNSGQVLVHIGHSEESNMLSVMVKDSGVGMEVTDREKIFEPFTQLDMSATKSFEGAGIGLYVVKSIVEQIGGAIDIASQLGEGSEVSVLIPARRL